MEFDLTEQQSAIGEVARKLGHDFGVEYWTKKDQTEEFPREFWDAICESGLSGTLVPE
jgi:acyl-CoA dehydrogenase